MISSGRFYDGKKSKAYAVEVYCESESLIICSVEGEIVDKWEFCNLTLAQKDEHDSHVLLAQGDMRLYVAKAFFDQIRPHIKKRQWIFSHVFYKKTFLFLVAFLSMFIVVGSYLSIEKAAKLFVYVIPEKWDVYLGSYAEESLNLKKKLIKNKQAQETINKILLRVAAPLKDTPYEFKVYLISEKTPNAFALPGGHIYIHTGLIHSAKIPEEIAGVLSHEVGHIIQRHGSYQIFRYMISSFMFDIFLGGNSAGNFAAEVGCTLYLLHYSREAEREADKIGVKLMDQAQINPKGLIKFFKHIEQKERQRGANNSQTMSYMSTHPSTQERIDWIRARSKDFKGKTKMIISQKEWKELKAYID